ncbi:hypothetical protein [Mycobacteroides abscessus]|uniref:hypothetical protein n=1 Tax=Mycobacteroides abscessus TaxID=36809 RepID=UPI0009D21275|nr:hypothetical protein [Mycobacteroides abscessus]SLJ09434.1 Uncharacterised protein [Mycobacteroides abscessus subsp. abscessus]
MSGEKVEPVVIDFGHDDGEVTSVLLPDGQWHAVEYYTFKQRDDFFQFRDHRSGVVIEGPMSSLLAVGKEDV